MDEIAISDHSSKGGLARAKKLSPGERSAIARAAVEARWRKEGRLTECQRAIHDGVIRIGDIEILCHVLEDGTRLIAQGSFSIAIGRTRNSAGGRGPDIDKIAPFLATNNLKPFIDEDLAISTKPIQFISTQGLRVYGYRAEVLPRVCGVYLKARDAGALHGHQVRMGVACDIVMRGLAEVGIVALVDEATGYQDQRARDALAKILEAFVANELRKWVKTFPPEFYREIFRLRRWPYNGSVRSPRYLGKLTNDLVYARLAPGVLDELRRKNPSGESGRRKSKHHQWLTVDVGHPKLLQHLASVTTLMKASDEWVDFVKMVDRALPRQPDMPLFDLMRRSPVAAPN